MKGDDLPENDNIVRYVKPSMIQEDGTADGSDFRLRPGRLDEHGLSVNWLEVFGSKKHYQLNEVRRLCSQRLSLKATGKFAEMNVGAIISKVSEELNTIRIVHDPLDAKQDFEADSSHSQISNLPPGESEQAILVGDLIVECVVDLHPAINNDA